MYFTQPTIHHILYIESDSVQIAKYGFICEQPKSFWLSLENEDERTDLDEKLARLHKRGRIKLYFVGACIQGDDCSIEDMHNELNELNFNCTGSIFGVHESQP
jgi:hypothetical protein